MSTQPSKQGTGFAVFIGLTQIYAWASTYFLPSTLVKPVSEELGMSSITAIGGFSLALLSGGLIAPAIGRWIERSGGRKPLTFGSILVSAGLLTLAASQGVVVWYLGWLILGTGMALTLFNAVFSTMGQMFGHRAKQLIVQVTLLSGLASFFWPLTTHLLETQGWRTLLVIYAIPHLVLMAPLYWFLVPNAHEGTTQESEGPPSAVQEKGIALLYLLGGFAVLRTLVGSAVSVHVLGVFHSLGLTVERAAWVAALMGPAQIASRLIEFFFGHRISPIRSAIFWSAVLPLALLALLLAGASATLPFAIAFGMSNGMATISLSVLLMTYFDIKKYPTLMGKIARPTMIVQAAAPLLAASALDSMTVNRVLTLTLGISLAALALLATIAIIAAPNSSHLAPQALERMNRKFKNTLRNLAK